jgi:hypothetical protein
VLKLKRKNSKSRTQNQAKLSFKSEGEIKTFLDKPNLGEFITIRPAI